MTTGLTYATYKTQIATLAVVAETDANFLTILPMAITYAENRIYRDLDFLNTSTSGVFTATSGSRVLTIPEGTFVVTEQINVITPVGQSDPNAATRNNCLPVTKEWLDIVYGSAATTGLPKYFVPFNDNVFYLGPVPDAAYSVEIVGTYRPDSLSATNTSTFISLYLPDLMLMASMIYVAAYQRNFSSAMGNDPQMPVTYETQYQTLLKGAMVEEARKKFESSGWSSQSPAPVATPSRG